MNDCFWYACGACDDACTCKKYLSMNDDDGYAIMTVYEDEIELALAPLREKYKEKFNNF